MTVTRSPFISSICYHLTHLDGDVWAGPEAEVALLPLLLFFLSLPVGKSLAGIAPRLFLLVVAVAVVVVGWLIDYEQGNYTHRRISK